MDMCADMCLDMCMDSQKKNDVTVYVEARIRCPFIDMSACINMCV